MASGRGVLTTSAAVAAAAFTRFSASPTRKPSSGGYEKRRHPRPIIAVGRMHATKILANCRKCDDDERARQRSNSCGHRLFACQRPICAHRAHARAAQELKMRLALLSSLHVVNGLFATISERAGCTRRPPQLAAFIVFVAHAQRTILSSPCRVYTRDTPKNLPRLFRVRGRIDDDQLRVTRARARHEINRRCSGRARIFVCRRLLAAARAPPASHADSVEPKEISFARARRQCCLGDCRRGRHSSVCARVQSGSLANRRCSLATISSPSPPTAASSFFRSPMRQAKKFFANDAV